MSLTVSEFTKKIKYLIEANFNNVEIIGELSSFTRHSSGHIYMSIKDENSYLKAVIWFSTARWIKENFKIGDKVLIQGRISLYEKRGEYQLVVNNIKKYGLGDLYVKFEQLKLKLEKEGIFSKEKKKLPLFPKKIALLTADTGAAIKDFLNIAKRRNPNLNVIIIPTLVQGTNAAKNIEKNIKLANTIKDVEIIVLTRGGGSIEDLWSFNEEIVARTIFNSKLPVVSAIGHERDITIADFVSDKRAATPSEAAEIIFLEKEKILERLEMIKAKINKMLESILLYKINYLQKYKNKISKNLPYLIKNEEIKIERYKNRIQNSLNYTIYEKWNELKEIKNELQNNAPRKKLEDNKQKINILKINLENNINKKILEEKTKLDIINTKLNILSPNKILKKGYSLVFTEKGKLISSYKNLNKKDIVKIKLYDGEIRAKIIN